MRITLLSFFLLFNFITHVISCPSSGDGDCLPSTESYNQHYTQNSNQTITEKSNANVSSSSNNQESDGGLPDDHIAKPSNYFKKINENSKLNYEIAKLNFDLDNIIYNLSTKYTSNLSNQINDKLDDAKNLIYKNKNIDKNLFNSLHQNINELLDTIIYSFNNNKSLKLRTHKINSTDINYQINKYNEINDIVKTLEVMN